MPSGAVTPRYQANGVLLAHVDRCTDRSGRRARERDRAIDEAERGEEEDAGGSAGQADRSLAWHGAADAADRHDARAQVDRMVGGDPRYACRALRLGPT